jgi:predicted nucleic acid-binding protein
MEQERMKKYLLDTNILIYHASNCMAGFADVFDTLFTLNFNISAITVIEFLGWNGFSTGDMISKADVFISHAKVFGLEKEVIERAVLLRRSIKIEIPDAIIAATALVNSMDLVTANIKDFKNTGLRVVDITDL